jgi:ABC-type sugar transport system ATPase subunit
VEIQGLSGFQPKKRILLELKGVSKNFGGVKAVDKIDLQLYENEILALVGDNGAGKSTLIKIISGVYNPDEGEIYLEGKKVQIFSPQEAKKLGIETNYQDLALGEVLNIVANLYMGRPLTKFLGILDKKKMERESWNILKKLEIRNISSLKQAVRNLSGGQRQGIAIGRTVYVGRNPKIIIMDEPTAALGVEEKRKTLELIKSLRSNEKTIIFISHNMQDVFAVADRAVVLKTGKKVGERRLKETDIDEIVRLIIKGEDSLVEPSK